MPTLVPSSGDTIIAALRCGVKVEATVRDVTRDVDALFYVIHLTTPVGYRPNWRTTELYLDEIEPEEDTQEDVDILSWEVSGARVMSSRNFLDWVITHSPSISDPLRVLVSRDGEMPWVFRNPSHARRQQPGLIPADAAVSFYEYHNIQEEEK